MRNGLRHLLYHSMPLLMGASLALNFSSCTKKRSSSVKVTADFLHVRGELVLPGGKVASDAKIYASGLTDNVSVSDDSGAFRFTLSDTQIAVLQAAEQTAHGSFADTSFDVLVELEGSQSFVALVGPVAYSTRGTLDVGKIELAKPSTLNGRVEVLQSDGSYKAAANVQVLSGRSSASTDKEGNFSLTMLNAGERNVYFTGEGLALQEKLFELSSDTVTNLERPVYVFPEGLVAGSIRELPNAPSPSDLIASGHPYRRSFNVDVSPEAQFVRYSVNEADFQFVDNALFEWKGINDRLHFDFPGNGTHTLFYQFANADQSLLSEVSSLVIYIDLFADSEGIVIGDGSGLVQSGRVIVNIDVPAAAVEMRLSDNIIDFTVTPARSATPFQKIAPVTEYIFSPTANGNPNQLRELFCQFRAADGTESSIYRTSVLIKVFPDQLDPFRIEGGATSTPKRIVDVAIDLPENAYELRIFEEIISGGTTVGGVLIQVPTRQLIVDTFIRASETLNFVFLNSGRKTLFLQFRDRAGIVSPVYKQDIFILPFEPTGIGFLINGGAPTTKDRDLSLTLQPPPTAVAYRVGESALDVALVPFTVLRDQVGFRARSIGLTTLYLQYQDINGETSYVYSQDIYIDPFFSDPGGFVINGGAPTAVSPLLQLQIIPPVAAVEMNVTEVVSFGNGSATCGNQGLNELFASGWVHASSNFELLVRGTGLKVICIRFRTFNGDFSPYLQQTIVYDPFPLNIGAVFINGGAPVTFVRDVQIDLVIPPNATGMRIAQTLGELVQSPFVDIRTPILQYRLQRKEAGDDKLHQVFVQFIAPDGEFSEVFSDEIRLELFPVPHQFLVINNGAPSTVSNQVKVKFDPPPAAESIRLSTMGDFSGETTKTFDVALLEVDFELPPTINSSYHVYGQYVTDDGIGGPVFSSKIVLNNLPPASPVLQGGGNLFSSKTFTIELNLPAVATQFAWAVSKEEISGGNIGGIFGGGSTGPVFQEVVSELDVSIDEVPITEPSQGFTFYMIYRTDDDPDQVSVVFALPLQFELFPADDDLAPIINGGAASTNDPELTLTISPGEAVTAIEVSESKADIEAGLVTPMPPSPTVSYILQDLTLGTKTICIRYTGQVGSSPVTSPPIACTEIELVP